MRNGQDITDAQKHRKVTKLVRKEKNELQQKQYSSPGYAKLYLMLHGADEE